MMRIFLRCFQLTLVIIILFSLLALASAYSQADGGKVFATVPERLRPRLAERLELVVEYEREQKWDEQYNLLSPLFLQGATKEAYIERRQSGRGHTVLGFIPKYTARMYEGRWEIFGCIKVRKGGKTQELNGEVAAFLEAGDWRFSQVFFDKERCSR